MKIRGSTGPVLVKPCTRRDMHIANNVPAALVTATGDWMDIRRKVTQMSMTRMHA